ncbi:MAG: ferritin [Candidatus Hydrogenedentota bacterium]|nr:MAG: ferritin [Candidatus Hydrogenedentota bacterium]
MKLAKQIEKKLNDQVNFEIYSAYYYLGMAAWCEERNLNGAGHFFRLQAKEELEHAMKFFDYILERGGSIALEPISRPAASYKSLRDVVSAALKHEREVTSRIEEMMDSARAKKDYATQNLLDWFVEEQVEEENSMEKILARMDLAGDKGAGLLMIDKELGKRGRETS